MRPKPYRIYVLVDHSMFRGTDITVLDEDHCQLERLWRYHMTFVEQIEEIRACADRNAKVGTVEIQIEGKANGPTLVNELRALGYPVREIKDA